MSIGIKLKKVLIKLRKLRNVRKFRIVEKVDTTGEICFFPQHKKFGFWIGFMEMEVFPKMIKFYSLDKAKKFLSIQMNNPNPKIHYME